MSCRMTPRLRSIQLVAAPRAANVNLHAQDGLFTMSVVDNDWPSGSVDRRTLDTLIAASLRSSQAVTTVFLHFTLPGSQAGELLWWLNKNQVNAARLFPGFDGAAKALKEHRHLRSPSW